MPTKKLRPSFAFTEDRLAQLKAVVPEAFADGKINWKSLKQALGEFLEDENQDAEHFGLFWPGKREARRLATLPSKGTLVPAAGEGVDEDKTRNIFIEGENLEVLKLLQKSYAGRIKMIYIDPPYNTGNDFVYRDDERESLYDHLHRINLIDENGSPLTSNTGHKKDGKYANVNTRRSARFHSNWLSMMYSRLVLSRQLLQIDGVIFVSVDDNEIQNLRQVMNEVFGEENFIANIVWQKKYTRSNDAKWFSDNHDHILVYASSADSFELNLEPRTDEQKSAYTNPDNHPKGPWKATPLHAKSGNIQGFSYKFKNGFVWSPPTGTYPRFSKETLAKLDKNDEIWFGKDGGSTPSRKSFLVDVKSGVTPVTVWLHEDAGHTHEANNELKALGMPGFFDNPKPTRLIRKMLQLATSAHENELILDFFAGSCTTANALLDLNREDGGNRRFIMVQLPEPTPDDSPARKAGYDTIAKIGKERIRRVIAKMKKEGNGKSSSKREKPEDLSCKDLGFKVFKLARSNFKAWQDYDGENIQELEKLLDQAETPLVEGWKEEDLLTEIMLQQGFPLDSKITPQSGFKQNKVQLIESEACGHRLFVCLDPKIKEDTIKHLELRTEDIFVCRDSALTDQAKMRLADVCRSNIT
ncbi:MAG: hypothetical protein DKINENOH_00601 [bacterium]|nr:hypothetical protein [bacterium]